MGLGAQARAFGGSRGRAAGAVCLRGRRGAFGARAVGSIMMWQRDDDLEFFNKSSLSVLCTFALASRVTRHKSVVFARARGAVSVSADSTRITHHTSRMLMQV